MLAQPLVYHAIHSDKAAGEYQTLCHKPQYRLTDLARGRSEKSHEGKHDGCDDADQRCHLLITDTLHDKNLLLGSAPLASGEQGTAVRLGLALQSATTWGTASVTAAFTASGAAR